MVELIGRIDKSIDTEEVGKAAAGVKPNFSGNPFEEVLSKAVDALNKVSATEFHANQMIDKYLAGEVDMAEAMIATSKMSIMVQFAVTTINTAVTTFKEVTQMQI